MKNRVVRILDALWQFCGFVFMPQRRLKGFMTQDEKWLLKYNEVVAFIENNKRNPSKHDDEERGLYLNWIKHNKKLYAD